MNARRRHRDAVGQSLAWAQAAADAGDFEEALAWLDTVEVIAAEMPPGWAKKRGEWVRAQERALEAVTE
jgi:hypothetical protein